MGITLRKAKIAEDGKDCIIENAYEKGEEVTIIKESHATHREKICISANKVIQIVHAYDLFYNGETECEVDENNVIDYDLGTDAFNLIVNEFGEVGFSENKN